MVKLPDAYLHILDGRIRVKVLEVKGARQTARQLEEQLQRLEAISEVRANHHTGNVLVYFDPDQCDAHAVLNAIESLGYLPHPTLTNFRRGMVATRHSDLLDQAYAATWGSLLKFGMKFLVAIAG